MLPNHYLFILAEQPPADIAGLLSLFQHVPPVVRRRAKELLEAIRQAAAVGTEESAVPVPAAQEVSHDPMEVDGARAEHSTEVPVIEETSTLWPSGAYRLCYTWSSLVLTSAYVPRYEPDISAIVHSIWQCGQERRRGHGTGALRDFSKHLVCNQGIAEREYKPLVVVCR